MDEEHNRLLSEQSTAIAEKAHVDETIRAAPPANSPDSAATATALVMQSLNIESTKQAIEDRQRQLEATQTAIAQSPPTIATIVKPIETNIPEGSIPGVPETRLRLKLSDDQIIMGTADKFQDSLDQHLPPFAVFVVYGPIDEDITLPWGGWDQWRNASSSLVESELRKKIEQTKENHPSDWITRGISVYRCRGSMHNCTIEMLPTN